MADQGTSFEIGLGVSGGTAVDAGASSLANLKTALEQAGAASTAASGEVKASEAAYRQAEAAADRAAKAVEKIGLAADAQRGKLAAAMQAGDEKAFWRAATAIENLNVRQAEAVAKADAAKSALNAQAASLDKIKASAKAAADAEDQVAKAHEHAKKAADAQKKAEEEAAASAKKAADTLAANAKKVADAQKKSQATADANIGKVNELAEGFGKLGGPLGAAGQKAFGAADAFKKLGSSLGAAGPYVAIAIALVAIATAAIGATAALISFAIANADAARTQQLLADGVAGSVAGGRELDKTIHDLADVVPQTREELLGMASELAKTGLKGAALSSALEEAAIKAAKLKYGPDFQKQTLALSNQATRLKANIAGIFGGLNIESVLEGLAKIIGLFDSTSVTGQAIKVLFESIFQPAIDGLASLAPKIVSTFILVEIWALKAAIAVKPYASKILLVVEALGVLAAIIVGIVLVVLGLLVAGSLAFATVLAGVLFVMYTIAGVFVDVATAAYEFAASIVQGATNATSGLISKITEAIDWLSGLSLAEIGAAMIDGLIAGITGAGAGVLSSITGVVGGAIDGAKNLLGIASPSKVFEEIGQNTADGMAQGVDGATGDVQGALKTMVAPPAAGSSSSSEAAPSSGGGDTYVITIQGGGDAESNVAAFTAWLERKSAQLGRAVPTPVGAT